MVSILIQSDRLGTANGLIPLLPVNASRLGATASITGLYLAIAYLAKAAGTMGAPLLA